MSDFLYAVGESLLGDVSKQYMLCHQFPFLNIRSITSHMSPGCPGNVIYDVLINQLLAGDLYDGTLL